MRKRTKSIKVRLYESEMETLEKNAKKAGLPKETYIRMYINGHVPKANPDEVFWSTMRQLYGIGNNMDQIARIANATGNIDADKYNRNFEKLCEVITKIDEAMLLPEKVY